jgi:DNA helicase-2/ATP-dependent DNA helicase PcrA
VDLDHFSPNQREIVQAGDGPLSILAGPGSGKTTVLAGRIAYLVVERNVPPSSILAITFTTAAAATLRQRLAGVLGDAANDVTITTFHALGLRLIKQWSHELGFGHSLPAVYGREDARAVLREAAAGLGLELAPEPGARDADPWAAPLASLAAAVERFRLAGAETTVSPHDDGVDQELVRPLSAAYDALLQQRGAIDYASMLTMPLHLFVIQPRALRVIQDTYRFVLADEFQDTCATQFRLLRQIVERHHNLAVVGDPRQTVYTWRGADPSLLLEFARVYPDARIFPLDQNHRSTGVIVALGNALAAPLQYGGASWTSNVQGPRARLYGAVDEVDEAQFVAHEIQWLLGSGAIDHAGQVAILFRTNVQARTLVLTLRTAGLPFRVRADADLFGQPEVRDVVAYLRLAHCPSDGPALARVINVPPRRLRAVEQALRKRPVPIAELPLWAQKRGGPPARQAVEQLIALVENLHQATGDCRPVLALEAVLDRTEYAVWLADQENGRARLTRLEELRAVMEASPAPDLATWLTDLHIGDVDGPPDAKAVALSTIHSAKGGEWPVVFVVGLEDGLLPHLRPGRMAKGTVGEDEEERRLAYVAISRTQVLLYLVYCRTRRLSPGGAPARLEPRRPSRFLHALPAHLIERVDHPRVA